MKGLQAAELSMGAKELKRFTDTESCARFLDTVFASSLVFGIDIYNGYCAGRTKITRESKALFRINAEDKLFFCEFRLKSLILYLPDLSNETSPVIFIECDTFTEKDPKLKHAVGQDFHGIQHTDFYRLHDGTVIVGEEQMDAFHETADHGEYESIVRFYSAGILCFMNVQGLKYNYSLKYLVEANRFTDGKDFEVGVRDFLEGFEKG